jgi:hypothetical protein
MSGAASGAFSCEAHTLLFMPTYKDLAARGNTQLGVMSTARFQKGTPPPGVDLVSLSVVFRGSLHPGTYTEKDVVKSQFDMASVQLQSKKNLFGLKRIKFVVKSTSPGNVHEDIVTKNGPTRDDKFSGELEAVIGDASGEASIHATFE